MDNTKEIEPSQRVSMTLIADAYRDLLKELHAHGSVRNLRDRRSDHYRLELRQQPNAEQQRRDNGERTQRKRPTG